MPRIAFQKEPDKLEFFDIKKGYLIAVCHEFAKLFDEDIYRSILNEKVSVSINDNIISVDDWCTTEVIEDDEIIISPSIEGGDSGVLQIIIGVVIAVASFYLGPAGYAGASSLLSASVAQFGIALGVSVALGGLSSLLFQPDLPSLPSISSSKQTQTYNWSGIKTVAQVDTPIPIVYGKHPVGGNIISLFVENDGNDSYLNMLLALCEGEIEGICQEKDTNSVCTTSDPNDSEYKDPAIKLDDQPLKFYDDVEWWYRKGSNLPDTSKSPYNPNYQNIIPHFDGARLQYDDGREVTADQNYIEYITTKEVDQVYLNFFIPQLYNGEGSDLVEESVRYKVQYSTDGNTFYDYSGPGTYKYEPSVSGSRSQYCTCNSYRHGNYKYSFKEPTYVINITSNNFLRKYNRLKTTGVPINYEIEIDILDSDSNLIESKIITQSFHQEVIDPAPEGGGGPIYGHLRYYNTQFYIGNYKVILDHDVISGDSFTISSALTSVEASETIVVTGKTKTGIYTTIRIDFNEAEGLPGRDIYYLRATRVDGGKSDSLKTANNLVLQSVIEIVNGQFIYPNTALLGLRIKATGQLSGTPPNTVTTLKGTKIAVPDLSGSEAFQDQFWDDTDGRWEYNDLERTWDNSTYTTEYSNNSMLCVRNLVLSERYGLGSYYSSSDIDTSEVITAIRECWKRFDPYSGEDYLKWWDSGTDSDWLNNWEFSYASYELSKSYNSASRTITVTGNGKYNEDNKSTDYLHLSLNTTPTLKINQSYDLSITFSGIDFPVTIKVYGITNEGSINLGSLQDKTDGTHSLSFTVSGNYKQIKLSLYGVLGSSSYTISDISLTKTASSYEHYHTWNGVIESGQSALTVLLEMCDAFRCWPIWHSGKINFVSDRDTTPIHTLSVGNTEKFSQSFTPLSELPYKVIGQFTDEARDFNLRSLVSRSSLTDLIKINEKTISLKGLTSKAKAERELKFKHGKATRSSHNVAITCGVDLIHGTAGDIIKIQDDLPQWGHGGNIITYTATNLTIDSPYTFSNAATNTFVVRYQGIDNSQLSATIDTTGISTNDSLQTFPVSNLTASPAELSAFSLDTSGQQSKEFRILSTNRSEEDKVDITCIEHISALYDSEATLSIVKDYTPLEPKNPNLIPKAPVNIIIVPLPPSEGMGFAFSARPHPDDHGVIEIVVQLDRTGNREFETIGILSSPNWNSAYSDPTLKFDYSYKFRFYCKTANKTGQSAEASASISKNALAIEPPKGLRIKGKTLNSSQFDGKDVTIIWDSVGLSTDLNYSLSGYKINVYKNSILNANLLRTDFSNTEEYTYTYDMNVGDNGTANGTLVFQLTTLTTNGLESVKSSHITVSNSSPSTPSGLVTEPWMRGMKFSWDKNAETDLDHYSYRTRGIVGTLAFTGQTGSFSAGDSIVQWDGDGTQLASATVDGVGIDEIYISNISGTFENGKIFGVASYGSELITDSDDRNFTGGDIGNWIVEKDGSGTCAYSADDLDGTDDKQALITSNSDTYLYGKLRTDYLEALTTGEFCIWTFNGYIPSGNTQKTVQYKPNNIGVAGSPKYTDFTGSEDGYVGLTNIFQVSADNGELMWGFWTGSQPSDGDKFYTDDHSLKQITNAALVNGTLSGDELGYDSLRGSFSVGANLVGASSGATATVVTGSDNTTSSIVHVGLPFNSDVETLKLDPGDAGFQGKIKRITELILRLYQTAGTIQYGRNSSNLDSFSLTSLTTGDKEKLFEGLYETDGQVFIRKSDAGPITIQALLPIIEVYNR